MSLSKDEIARIYELKKKLDVTYKASSNSDLRKRVKKDIDDLELVISDIENGRWVNPVKLKLFSKTSMPSTDGNNQNPETGTKNTFLGNIEITKITRNSRDQDMDQIYSWLIFFDTNFYPALTIQNLRLKYEYGRRRDDLLLDYDLTKRQIEQYKDDNDTYQNLPNENQRRMYEERIFQERNAIIIKINELFTAFKNLMIICDKSIKDNDSIVANPLEKYYNPHNKEKKSIFEGIEIETIIRNFIDFCEAYIEMLKLPAFMKKRT